MRMLEVCASTLEAAREAALGGAQRIELCRDLELDGLTPPREWIEEARRIEDLKLHVLIRPVEGGFVYDEAVFDQMREEIRMCRELGADGVVIGALTPDGDIDVEHLRPLMAEAQGMQVTFHRAFDVCRDPRQALEDIISLGCTRLLTSGQCRTAVEGIPLLRSLVEQAQGRIVIMPGAGVGPDNARQILQQTGATEIHGSLRSLQNGRLVTDARLVCQTLRHIVSAH